MTDSAAPTPASSPNPVTGRARAGLNRLLGKLKHIKGPIVAIASVGAVLSGLVGYWTTYQTVKVGVPAPTVSAASQITSPLSIMALPFANHTGDPQKAYIADALTTSITSDLSRIRDAFVIPTATAFTYKDKIASVQQVGRDAGVRFVLQGGVLSSGAIIRISAQLADTQSGAQLWSETFDGELTNLFALHDKVTTAVVNTIGREMVVVAARESEKRKSSPKVADLMLRARALDLKPQSLKNSQGSEALLRDVLALEPNNVSAMADLSDILTAQAHNYSGVLTPEAQERKYVEGRDLALKAKELDPGNPTVYWAIGSYAQSHDDFAGYRRANETLVSLQPKDAGAYNNLALSYLNGAEPQRAIELLTHAISLDPKDIATTVLLLMGRAYFMLDDNDVAIDWFLKSLEKNPAFPNTYTYLAMAYARKGDDAKARATVAELRRLAPNYTMPTAARPMSSSPAAYKEYFEKKFIPAWRKAGLPE